VVAPWRDARGRTWHQECAAEVLGAQLAIFEPRETIACSAGCPAPEIQFEPGQPARCSRCGSPAVVVPLRSGR
jgi:hypothetical protein